jgi:MFS superfamily sulfate permease-like transporter
MSSPPSQSPPPNLRPASALAELAANWRADLLAGFLVFLVALPLCLGIAMASGFPPVGGVFTAIVGGILGTFLGSARLTIKGPAAGLIVIALGAVTELGQGDNSLGYQRALAVGVIAGVIQIVFGLMKAGRLGVAFPAAVVHGMLAAIGVIITSKQIHTALGVSPEGKEPLHLLAEIPHSLANLNPEIAVIGAVSLAVLFGLPMLPFAWAKKVPSPMVVIALAIPLGLWFDLDHEHTYSFLAHDYKVGPNFLVTLPKSLLAAVTFPDFSAVWSPVTWKYVVMFSMVGTIESLLSTKAVDALDPERRPSDLDRDLLVVGVCNVVASAIGGLPMISEIVRSSANINNGAKTRWANFFHGGFLLFFVALLPWLLHQIPLAALAAMLIYTGLRLASPLEFRKTWQIGWDQLVVFVTTLLVTLATDLLLGVGVGILTKAALHVYHGAPLKSLLRPSLDAEVTDEVATVRVVDAAVFSNLIAVRALVMRQVEAGARTVVVDFSAAKVVDHTTQERMHELAEELERVGVHLSTCGLDNLAPHSAHPLSARRRA